MEVNKSLKLCSTITFVSFQQVAAHVQCKTVSETQLLRQTAIACFFTHHTVCLAKNHPKREDSSAEVD